jgi:hypothetical protein
MKPPSTAAVATASTEFDPTWQIFIEHFFHDCDAIRQPLMFFLLRIKRHARQLKGT